jgi:hypothetical protein
MISAERLGVVGGVLAIAVFLVTANFSQTASVNVSRGATHFVIDAPAIQIDPTHYWLPEPAASVMVFRNGLRLKVNIDYTLSGAVVTFLSASAPSSGDVLVFDYVGL